MRWISVALMAQYLNHPKALLISATVEPQVHLAIVATQGLNHPKALLISATHYWLSL